MAAPAVPTDAERSRTAACVIEPILVAQASLFQSTVPYASHLSSGGEPLNEKYYLAHRVETVRRIRRTARTDALALAEMVYEDYEAARWWSRYATEELGHDVLYLRDLAEHGIDSLDTFPELDATTRLIQYLENRIQAVGSLPAVAYSLLTEWNSELASEAVVRRAADRFSPRHVQGALEHIAVDEHENHYEQMLAVAGRLMSTDERVGVMADSLEDIGFLLREYFRELYETTVPNENLLKVDTDNAKTRVGLLISRRAFDDTYPAVIDILESEFADSLRLCVIVTDDSAEEDAAPRGGEWRSKVPRVQVSSQRWRTTGQERPDGSPGSVLRVRKQFERDIVRVLKSYQVDLVLCDHFMPILKYSLLDTYSGRILNVHPGICVEGDPFAARGRTPVRDFVTRATLGRVIVDDKRRDLWPSGPVSWILWEDRWRLAVEVATSRETGVTVSMLTRELDRGPVVACQRFMVEPRQLGSESDVRNLMAGARSAALAKALERIGVVKEAPTTKRSGNDPMLAGLGRSATPS